MKKILQLFLLMVPLGVCAQQGMSQADLEQMLQQAEKMGVWRISIKPR